MDSRISTVRRIEKAETPKRKIGTAVLLTAAILIFVSLFVTLMPILNEGYNTFVAAASKERIAAAVSVAQADDSYLTINEIPADFIDALVKKEDHRFYNHNGIDPIAIARAVFVNICNGRILEGGSTITQQLAKNMFYTEELTFERKIAEAFTALRLETMYNKQTILELYCNIVYFGEDCYGLKEAAEHYYDAEPNDLSRDEMVILVNSLCAPSILNPNALAA